MKKYLLLAILQILVFAPHAMAAQFNKSALIAQEDTSLSKYREPIDEDVLKKTPLKAFAIGFAPGFFVHGLGHYYAGNDKAGGWLLASEGISIVLGYYSMRGGIGAAESERSQKKYYNLGYTALAIFFAGWITDFADAPHQVNKRKAAYMNMQKISLGAKKGAVAVSYSFDL
jgi:hypothetical protein